MKPYWRKPEKSREPSISDISETLQGVTCDNRTFGTLCNVPLPGFLDRQCTERRCMDIIQNPNIPIETRRNAQNTLGRADKLSEIHKEMYDL
jgi:hypothetical protein